MKIISKDSVTRMILVLLAMALLGGCVPKMYSESQEEALVSSCLPAIEEFLADRYGAYELGEFHLQKGLIEPEKPLFGNYGSNIVRGSYTVDGNSWDLVYDSETGEFYTSELMEKLKQQESARILDYLEERLPEEELREFRVTVLDLYYLVQSHNIVIDNHKNTADTYVYINSVLPAGITEEGLPAFAERGFDGGIISNMRCHYYSDKKNALTDEDFQSFFADNPAYQVRQYLLIENDNPSAVDESAGGSKADAQDAQAGSEGAAGQEESTQVTEVWFRPEPVGKDSDCKIEYENGVVLARRPYFTESDGMVTMQFNNIDWYRVRVIRREDAEKYFPDEEMLAQSSNLKVFRSYGNQTYAYSCLFDPSDSSRDVFLFETDISPEAAGFGFGFGDYIHYYTDGKEVFPDTGLDRSTFENNGMERSVPKGVRSEEAILGNGGHFVKYEDRIFFRVPGGDSETIGYSINPEMNSGDMDSGVEEARELVESLKEVRERMEKGMKLRYSDPQTVDGLLMDVFELGTERKGQFVREYLYAADTVSGTVYRYNAGRNVWDQVMTEDLTSEKKAPSKDPLRGLVAEDILTKFRAAQPVVRDNGVREEAHRLGVWVQDSIGMDRLPSAVSAMGKRIGQKYEFWFGTDISNNLDSNFPKIYEAYFTLKDYYTSGGSVPFYEEISDENDFFGNGDPETIRMMYKDMQEFITACNNTIRKK